MLENANLLADGNLLTRDAPRQVQHLKIAHRATREGKQEGTAE